MTRRKLLAAAAVVAASAWLAPGAGQAHPGHGNRIVNISANQYGPADVSLLQNDTVVWVWAGPDTDHSVTTDAGQTEVFDSDPGGAPASSSHAVGDSFPHAFVTPGRYTYYCRTHPEMRGSVEVKGIDIVTPQIGYLRVRPSRFCRGRGKKCKRPRLEAFLSEDANISGQIERRVRGRWRLTRTLQLITFRRGPGRASLPTGGLAPGKYRLVAAARDTSGNRSRLKLVPFTVRKG